MSDKSEMEDMRKEFQGLRNEFQAQGTRLDEILKVVQTLAQAKPVPIVPDSGELKTKVMALQATVEVQQNQIDVSTREAELMQSSLDNTLSEKSKLEDELKQILKDRDKHKHEEELLQQKLSDLGHESEDSTETKDFPSNDTVLHNLLVAQLEFYFSNHHLKRDKPLMEKLCKEPHTGFLSLEDVAAFPKIRTLGQPDETVLKATRASKYLEVKKTADGKFMVGRSNFLPPKPAEFPFRRTVFVYGIDPRNESEHWIREQFTCFGKIAKVKFDSGPHTLPRKVGSRLLTQAENRVVRLHMRDSEHTEYSFRNTPRSGLTQYMCRECGKMKEYTDGYYVPCGARQFSNHCVYCVQCAAKKAESNLEYFHSRVANQLTKPEELEQCLGIDNSHFDDRNLNSFRTCLVVFESQRQASKCVYVRSRLGIEGCFATHFHNYTRHKREISQGNVDLELIVPRTPVFNQNTGYRLKESTPRQSNRNMGVRIESGMNLGFGALIPPAMRKNQSAPTLNHRRFPNPRFSRPI